MIISQDPEPFPADGSYEVTASGGTPPYTFTAEPSPPNPIGMQVAVQGSTATVTVPASTPSSTQVYILVKDSAKPPKSRVVENTVQ